MDSAALDLHGYYRKRCVRESVQNSQDDDQAIQGVERPFVPACVGQHGLEARNQVRLCDVAQTDGARGFRVIDDILTKETA